MMDDRALAGGLLGLFAIIIIGALLFTLFDPGMGQITEMSSQQATNSQANSHIDTLETIWNNILFYPLFLGALFIIAKGVAESRRPG